MPALSADLQCSGITRVDDTITFANLIKEALDYDMFLEELLLERSKKAGESYHGRNAK